jgi:hypothetical protein
MTARVGWWPRHWGAAAWAAFPLWWAYRLLLWPTLLLSRGLTWACPGRRWRDRVDDHVVLGGAILPGDVDALRREGVGAVVNLCAEFRDPVERLAAAGIAHLDLPTLDRHPPSPEALARGVAFLREQAARGVTSYVHCASGAGRSATLVACYFVSRGMPPAEAIRALREKRRAVAPRACQRRAVEAFRA